MAWKPRGLVGIRGAILHLAKFRKPDARIDDYVAGPWPTPPGTSSDPIRSILSQWDPYQRPRHGSGDTAWLAIEAAREEVLQALGDGEIRAVILDTQTGEQNIIPMQMWRSEAGPRAANSGTVSWSEGPAHTSVLLRKNYGGDVYVHQNEMEVFYSSGAQSAPAQTPDLDKGGSETAVHIWMTERAQTERSAGRWIKGEAAIKECADALSCTHRTAKAAFHALPPNLRRTRGQKDRD